MTPVPPPPPAMNDGRCRLRPESGSRPGALIAGRRSMERQSRITRMQPRPMKLPRTSHNTAGNTFATTHRESLNSKRPGTASRFSSL